MRLEEVQVECYSGYKVNERPRAVTLHGERQLIVAILDRWYEGGTKPGHPPLDYFKVRLESADELLLRYNHSFDTWAVVVSDDR